MKIYVNGDSHSAGAEAAHWACFAEDDWRYQQLNRQAHPDNIRASYGQHVADYLDAELICEAESAGSNDRIIRTTDEYLHQNKHPDLIIIGWSTWEREEWLHQDTYYQVTASGTDDVPADLKDKYKQWVIDQNHISREKKLLDWHDLIYKFHTWLDYQKIPHLFFNTYSDFSPIRHRQITTHNVPEPPPEYNWGNSYIDPYDHDLTYYYWLKNHGFKTVNPDSYHYGADAHRAWAEFLIQSYVQKLLTHQQ